MKIVGGEEGIGGLRAFVCREELLKKKRTNSRIRCAGGRALRKLDRLRGSGRMTAIGTSQKSSSVQILPELGINCGLGSARP